MPSIDVYITSIQSNPALRGRHERVIRHLTSARVPYNTHDVASDEAAKSWWKRKNGGNNELPCILVDDVRVGSIEDLDEAVEFGEFRQFLRLDSPPPPPPDFEKSSPPPLTTGTTSPKLVSLDDFASLNLTPDELAALEAEIRGGETFDSALPPSSSRPQQTYSSTTHHAVQSLRITKSVVDANGEKVNVVRPLPDRPLASEVVKDDFEGIDDVPEDELEALARELEEEERAAAGDRAVEEEAPLPTPPVPGAATKSEVGDKQETIPAEQRSNKAEVEELKKGLNARKEEGEVVGEVPALGTPAMVKRVAAAIRDGTL